MVKLVVETKVDDQAKAKREGHVDLDDRCFAFPQNLQPTHLRLRGMGTDSIQIAAVFDQNTRRTDPEIDTLTLDDAYLLCRKLVDAYYQGSTQHVLTETTRIAIVFNPQGFLVRFRDRPDEREVFLSPLAFLRSIRGLQRVLDAMMPGESN